MKDCFFEKIDIKIDYPKKKGRYFIYTVSRISNGMTSENMLSARFDGNKFDVNNQTVTHWLRKVDRNH